MDTRTRYFTALSTVVEQQKIVKHGDELIDELMN